MSPINVDIAMNSNLRKAYHFHRYFIGIWSGHAINPSALLTALTQTNFNGVKKYRAINAIILFKKNNNKKKKSLAQNKEAVA